MFKKKSNYIIETHIKGLKDSIKSCETFITEHNIQIEHCKKRMINYKEALEILEGACL